MGKNRSSMVQLKIYNKRKKLLDMLYTPSELSEVLEVSKEYIYQTFIYKSALPFTKDKTGHVFVNGMDVYKWIDSLYTERKIKHSNHMAENEFYCLKCKKRQITDVYNVSIENGQNVKIANCPICGTRLRKYM